MASNPAAGKRVAGHGTADKTSELTALGTHAREARQQAVFAWLDLMDVTEFAAGALQDGYWADEARVALERLKDARGHLDAALAALEQAEHSAHLL